ncbi:MAG: beta-L-arabinofuranosidase domain-containing protein [Armatimonadota bacterium]
MLTHITHIRYSITMIALAVGLSCQASNAEPEESPIQGLTGTVTDVVIAVSSPEKVTMLDASKPPADINLKRMAGWALNYLIETPRKDLGYEPVFQCYLMQCPPVPEGTDPVVSCDTDARMDWEWYYMRDITGSKRGLDIEAAFHNRMKEYIDPEGKVWSAPGAYSENMTTAVYTEKDHVIHIWGATKILKSLSEDYIRTKNPESKALANKVMLALKKLATWDDKGRCYMACGMGAFDANGKVIPNGWNPEPAPIVESLVTYWKATGDPEGLSFANAYADGIMDNLQPDGIHFNADGSFFLSGEYHGHTHATMHAIWGIADLGLVTGEKRYQDFAKNIWDFVRQHMGTGTGWFSAAAHVADFEDETCNLSDMMSIAALIGRSGHPEYFDYVERYLRNYVSNSQFIYTSEFEAYYRENHKSESVEKVDKALVEIKKFQGGILAIKGLNDIDNELFGGVGAWFMAGCCAPEGMRAIYTTWTNTIDRLPKSPLGPAGVYVNMSFNRESKWGKVVSFMPAKGKLTVKASVKDTFFLRPPHWALHDQVHAFVNAKPVPVEWSGAYVKFAAKPGDELTITYPLLKFTQQVEGLWKSTTAPDLKMTYKWLGNMVVGVTPAASKWPLFLGHPRVLPPAPGE